MVSQTGPRVVRSNSCKRPVYPGKGPASVIWDKISEIWPQKGQPGNPACHTRNRFMLTNFACPITKVAD